jgi:proline iminopeptidase
MAQLESVRIKTDGATLALRHFPGSGDPIVLLHGGPGMGDYFGPFPEVLSPPYSVVSYNQRGCGPSSCDGSFEVEKQVADLDAVRLHLKADRVHLFGHSWGGLLAQLYAKAHPQHVASLVLCCSMGNTGSRVAAMESKGIAERVIAKPKRSPAAWAFAGTLMQLPGKLGDLGFGLIMKQLLPNYVVRPELAPKTFNIQYGSKRAWRGTNKSVKALGDDYLGTLSFDAPVLIVQGEHDVIRETNAVLAARFPAATNVRIENTGHFPWVEEPVVFSRTVLDFYETVSSGAPVHRAGQPGH